MRNYLILLAFCAIGAFAQGFIEAFFKDYPNVVDIFTLAIPFALGYIYHDITKGGK